ncbi:hypothetical protein AB1Y20_004949 [Prymnesium parvum]|uniref:Receptor ligand binding region domain-containing protein n=1 Tax=Prymnesium parvum TaxID=97485 RepID=A0AB34J2S5_PRYPA
MTDGCVFQSPYSTKEGGTVYLSGGSAIVSESTITDSGAGWNGGVIYVRAGNVTVANRTLVLRAFAEQRGGVLNLGAGRATFFNGSSFVSCRSIFGGVLFVSDGVVNIANRVSLVNSESSYGGAVYTDGGTVTITGQSSVVGSYCSWLGGAFYINSGGLSISDGSLISNSSVNVRGGTFYINSGTATVRDSTVSRSDAQFGGCFSIDGVLQHLLLISRIALISSGDEYGNLGKNAFYAAAESSGVRITTAVEYRIDATDFSDQLRLIAQSRSRVLVLISEAPHGAYFLLSAFLNGVGGEGYLWMYSNPELADETNWQHGRAHRLRTLKGSFSLQLVDGSGQPHHSSFLARQSQLISSEAACSLEMDDDENAYLWVQDHDSTSSTPHACPGPMDRRYDAFGYDAVFALAHALHNLIEVQHRQEVVDRELLDALLYQVDFQGITGRVHFHDASSRPDKLHHGDRAGATFELMNFDEEEPALLSVGVWSPSSLKIWRPVVALLRELMAILLALLAMQGLCAKSVSTKTDIFKMASARFVQLEALNSRLQPCFWWEILSLIQRTTLTGWLLLINFELRFIRLLAALVVSISFLIILLALKPYKRSFDYTMAAGCQILFVCIFIGGIIVRLYEDISTDSNGSKELAYRFLGLHSSEEVIIGMILIAFSMLALLAFTVASETYAHLLNSRLTKKWSVCTMDPPYIEWRPTGIYACFLSHYKMEASSDARYMHDMLRKMLKAPVFLDSSALNDLRNLITEGVHKSDTLVLLVTQGVFSRPWCLLELLEVAREGIPVVMIQMANSQLPFEEARKFILNLESEMKRMNPAGLEFLHQRLGTDLEELKSAVQLALDDNEQYEPIVFGSHAGDNAMVATMKDVVERMAKATGRNIKWKGENLTLAYCARSSK